MAGRHRMLGRPQMDQSGQGSEKVLIGSMAGLLSGAQRLQAW